LSYSSLYPQYCGKLKEQGKISNKTEGIERIRKVATSCAIKKLKAAKVVLFEMDNDRNIH
jgi:hypothetical protein